MFLHTWHPHAILVHLGPLTIHWYGLTLAVGALAGFLVLRWLGKKNNVGEAIIFDLFLTVIIAGIVGARLYHVTNEWAYYSQNPNQIFQIWNGGLAWHGGLLAGLIAVIIFARRKRLSFWLLADILSPALALGQAIGRWGNYFNQELFGRPTSLPWGIPIDAANRPAGFGQYTFFQPTFLYESLGCLVIFAVLLWLHQRRWKTTTNSFARRPGTITLIYLTLAAALRIGTESLRIDHTPTIGALRLPILVGSLIILGAVATWMMFFIKRKTAHGA